MTDQVELADLSELEKEALALLRKDEPRILKLFAMSAELRLKLDDIETSLCQKGLVRPGDTLYLFLQLTPEGARLQAELFAGDAP